ncbi:MAG: hypothetical protein IME94_07780 [Proteobacteria bacterium]|nr:hypothetical protein [Pseudomonadota bacterium]
MDKNDNHQLNKQALELEMVNISQGLEEFATFVSFQSRSDNFRILSVESVERDLEIELAKQSIDVLDLEEHRSKKRLQQQFIKKSLSFLG